MRAKLSVVMPTLNAEAGLGAVAARRWPKG